MGAMTYNIPDIEIGGTFSMEVTITDEFGAVFDLTDYTPTAAAKVAPTDEANAFTFTCSKPYAGVVALDITAADTATITTGRYFYRMLLTNGTTVYPVIKGYCSVVY